MPEDKGEACGCLLQEYYKDCRFTTAYYILQEMDGSQAEIYYILQADLCSKAIFVVTLGTNIKCCVVL